MTERIRTLPDAELAVMQAVWACEAPAKRAQISAILDKTHPMAPTTLLGMKTATTPYGRRVDLNGYPFKISNVLSLLDGTCYVTRQSVHTPAAVRKAKAAIKKAFQNTLDKKGTSVVEIVSTCNSGWKMSPVDANKWMEENMFANYPMGDLKNE